MRCKYTSLPQFIKQDSEEKTLTNLPTTRINILLISKANTLITLLQVNQSEQRMHRKHSNTIHQTSAEKTQEQFMK